MIEIYNESCLQLTASDFAEFDAQITDPPYSEHVHKSAISQSAGGGTRKRDLGFESLSLAARRVVSLGAAHVRRWSVVYSDWESFNWIAFRAAAEGAEYVRVIPWVRWSMPQLSGDRPPQGSEAVVVLHRQQLGARGGRKPVKKTWNGPGNLTHLDEACLRGDGKHKTEKPLDQALRLVSYFSDEGETVVDPFCGAGTTAQACRILGRRCVGFETDPHWAEHAQRRTVGKLDARDAERLRRWLERVDEPTAVQEEGPSSARAERRAHDRDLAGTFLRHMA